MGLFDSLTGGNLGRSFVSEERGRAGTDVGWDSFEYLRDVRFARGTAVKNSIFWSCVTRTSSVISSAPIHLWQVNDDGQRIKRIRNSPVATMLQQPFPGINMLSWMRRASEDLEIYGEFIAYIWRDPITGRAKYLERVYPGDAERFQRRDGTYGYRVSLPRLDGNVLEITDYSGVLHIKGPFWGTLGDPDAAVSPLDYAISTAINMAEGAKDKINKENQLPSDNILTKNANVEGIVKAYKLSLEASKGAHVIWPNAVQDIKASRTPNDFAHKTRYLTAFEICAVYGWPPQLLGLTWEGTSIAGPLIPELKNIVIEHTISPRMAAIEAEFSMKLLRNTTENKDRAIKFSRIPFRLSEVQEAEITKKLRTDAGLLRRDEGRMRHGYQPLGGSEGKELVVAAGSAGVAKDDNNNSLDDD